MDEQQAFPAAWGNPEQGGDYVPGMTLRNWFAGQALSNPAICTGQAPEWQLTIWFPNRGGVAREEIAAKQAMSYASAMMAAVAKGETA